MADCLFCMIVQGKIPATVVYQDADVIAINDAYPRAPFHVLVMPKKHVPKLSELEDPVLSGTLLQAARKVARDVGKTQSYRLVINTGEGSGQSVQHLHLHLLAGRSFEWPPG
ncbi:MAG: histidine triad nucleotide-binding protein [Chloroflexi bacterium]|nr:MAG: histidine triad nucleotide-binding protein [Chloroflexota bacterium]